MEDKKKMGISIPKPIFHLALVLTTFLQKNALPDKALFVSKFRIKIVTTWKTPSFKEPRYHTIRYLQFPTLFSKH